MNKNDRPLFFLGLALAAGELYKQLFLYLYVHPLVYDWWYFPFQLCSLPLYLCPALPFVSGRQHTVLCTFLRDYNLIGGIAALVFPEGFRHIHWTLTLHGYLWHLALIGIGLYIHKHRMADSSLRGYLRTLPLLICCFAVATVINLAAPGHEADMFYLTPWRPSSQPVIREIAQKFGILPADVLYAGVICLAGFLMHLLFRFAEGPGRSGAGILPFGRRRG